MTDPVNDDRHGIDQLLTAYERGRLTRRQLLASLVMVGSASAAGAQAPAASPLTGRASRVQHVNLFVSNIRRSVEFYQKLGLPATPRPMYPRPGEAAYALDFTNGSFLSLIQTTDKDRVGRIDHFCVGIDNFNPDRDTAALREMGLKPTVADFDLLHMTDPDGIGVQMTDAKANLDCPRGIGYPPCEPMSQRPARR